MDQTHTEHQLERLEAFELAADRALRSGLHPASLHAQVANPDKPLSNAPRRRRVCMLQPTGWTLASAAALLPDRFRPSPGTREAHDELFTRARSAPTSRLEAVRRQREFADAARKALAAGWPAAELHRTIDSTLWIDLSDMYERAATHAIVSKVKAPRPSAPRRGSTRAAG